MLDKGSLSFSGIATAVEYVCWLAFIQRLPDGQSKRLGVQYPEVLQHRRFQILHRAWILEFALPDFAAGPVESIVEFAAAGDR